MKRFGFPFYLRAIAATLLAALLVQEAGWASPEDGLRSLLAVNPAAIHIQDSVGRIESIQRNGQGPLLIHIRDAHANPGAQKNIAEILRTLGERYGVRTVFLEGGTRDDSLGFLAERSDLETRKRVANQFVLAGELSGAELLNVTTHPKLKLLGVEEADLYDRNLRRYAEVKHAREKALQDLNRIRQRVGSLKRRLYSKEALEFDEAMNAFRSRKAAFSDTFEVLSDAIQAARLNPLSYPNLLGLSKLKEFESRVDFSKAQKELARVVHGDTSLNSRFKTELSDVSPFIGKLKRGSPAELQLFEALLASSLPGDVQALSVYVDYLRTFSKTNLERVLTEIEFFENEFLSATLDSTQARQLYAIDRHLDRLDDLFQMRISKDDFERLQVDSKQIQLRTVSILAFLNSLFVDAGRFGDVLDYKPQMDHLSEPAEAFYRENNRRDEAMMEHVRQAMQKSGEKIAVLIAGGYHTENLKALIAKQGFSYAIISPNVEVETNHARYEKTLLAGLNVSDSSIPKRPMMEMPSLLGRFQNEISVTPPPPVFAGARLAIGRGEPVRPPRPVDESATMSGGLASRRNFLASLATAVGLSAQEPASEMTLNATRTAFEPSAQNQLQALVEVVESGRSWNVFENSKRKTISLRAGDEVTLNFEGYKEVAGLVQSPVTVSFPNRPEISSSLTRDGTITFILKESIEFSSFILSLTAKPSSKIRKFFLRSVHVRFGVGARLAEEEILPSSAAWQTYQSMPGRFGRILRAHKKDPEHDNAYLGDGIFIAKKIARMPKLFARLGYQALADGDIEYPDAAELNGRLEEMLSERGRHLVFRFEETSERMTGEKYALRVAGGIFPVEKTGSHHYHDLFLHGPGYAVAMLTLSSETLERSKRIMGRLKELYETQKYGKAMFLLHRILGSMEGGSNSVIPVTGDYEISRDDRSNIAQWLLRITGIHYDIWRAAGMDLQAPFLTADQFNQFLTEYDSYTDKALRDPLPAEITQAADELVSLLRVEGSWPLEKVVAGARMADSPDGEHLVVKDFWGDGQWLVEEAHGNEKWRLEPVTGTEGAWMRTWHALAAHFGVLTDSLSVIPTKKIQVEASREEDWQRSASSYDFGALMPQEPLTEPQNASDPEASGLEELTVFLAFAGGPDVNVPHDRKEDYWDGLHIRVTRDGGRNRYILTDYMDGPVSFRGEDSFHYVPEFIAKTLPEIEVNKLIQIVSRFESTEPQFFYRVARESGLEDGEASEFMRVMEKRRFLLRELVAGEMLEALRDYRGVEYMDDLSFPEVEWHYEISKFARGLSDELWPHMTDVFLTEDDRKMLDRVLAYSETELANYALTADPNLPRTLISIRTYAGQALRSILQSHFRMEIPEEKFEKTLRDGRADLKRLNIAIRSLKGVDTAQGPLSKKARQIADSLYTGAFGARLAGRSHDSFVLENEGKFVSFRHFLANKRIAYLIPATDQMLLSGHLLRVRLFTESDYFRKKDYRLAVTTTSGQAVATSLGVAQLDEDGVLNYRIRGNHFAWLLSLAFDLSASAEPFSAMPKILGWEVLDREGNKVFEKTYSTPTSQDVAGARLSQSEGSHIGAAAQWIRRNFISEQSTESTVWDEKALEKLKHVLMWAASILGGLISLHFGSQYLTGLGLDDLYRVQGRAHTVVSAGTAVTTGMASRWAGNYLSDSPTPSSKAIFAAMLLTQIVSRIVVGTSIELVNSQIEAYLPLSLDTFWVAPARAMAALVWGLSMSSFVDLLEPPFLARLAAWSHAQDGERSKAARLMEINQSHYQIPRVERGVAGRMTWMSFQQLLIQTFVPRPYRELTTFTISPVIIIMRSMHAFMVRATSTSPRIVRNRGLLISALVLWVAPAGVVFSLALTWIGWAYAKRQNKAIQVARQLESELKQRGLTREFISKAITQNGVQEQEHERKYESFKTYKFQSAFEAGSYHFGGPSVLPMERFVEKDPGKKDPAKNDIEILIHRKTKHALSIILKPDGQIQIPWGNVQYLGLTKDDFRADIFAEELMRVMGDRLSLSKSEMIEDIQTTISERYAKEQRGFGVLVSVRGSLSIQAPQLSFSSNFLKHVPEGRYVRAKDPVWDGKKMSVALFYEPVGARLATRRTFFITGASLFVPFLTVAENLLGQEFSEKVVGAISRLLDRQSPFVIEAARRLPPFYGIWNESKSRKELEKIKKLFHVFEHDLPGTDFEGPAFNIQKNFKRFYTDLHALLPRAFREGIDTAAWDTESINHLYLNMRDYMASLGALLIFTGTTQLQISLGGKVAQTLLHHVLREKEILLEGQASSYRMALVGAGSGAGLSGETWNGIPSLSPRSIEEDVVTLRNISSSYASWARDPLTKALVEHSEMRPEEIAIRIAMGKLLIQKSSDDDRREAITEANAAHENQHRLDFISRNTYPQEYTLQLRGFLQGYIKRPWMGVLQVLSVSKTENLTPSLSVRAIRVIYETLVETILDQPGHYGISIDERSSVPKRLQVIDQLDRLGADTQTGSQIFKDVAIKLGQADLIAGARLAQEPGQRAESSRGHAIVGYAVTSLLRALEARYGKDAITASTSVEGGDQPFTIYLGRSGQVLTEEGGPYLILWDRRNEADSNERKGRVGAIVRFNQTDKATIQSAVEAAIEGMGFDFKKQNPFLSLKYNVSAAILTSPDSLVDQFRSRAIHHNILKSLKEYQIEKIIDDSHKAWGASQIRFFPDEGILLDLSEYRMVAFSSSSSNLEEQLEFIKSLEKYISRDPLFRFYYVTIATLLTRVFLGLLGYYWVPALESYGPGLWGVSLIVGLVGGTILGHSIRSLFELGYFFGVDLYRNQFFKGLDGYRYITLEHTTYRVLRTIKNGVESIFEVNDLYDSPSQIDPPRLLLKTVVPSVKTLSRKVPRLPFTFSEESGASLNNLPMAQIRHGVARLRYEAQWLMTISSWPPESKKYFPILRESVLDEYRGLPYLVTDLPPGQSLHEVLAKEDSDQPSSMRLRLAIAKQLLSALSVLHQEKMVHNGISPENIYIQNRENEVEVMISNFSAASASGEKLVLEPSIIENEYASPELVGGKPLDPRSDVYAAGLVLYELFSGIGPSELRAAGFASGRHSRISPDIRAILERALSQDPGNRYVSAQEMLFAFEYAVRLGARLATEVFVTPEEFASRSAQEVATEIRRLQTADSDKIVQIVFATGNTMIGFLDELAKVDGVNWKKVGLWHQDEYLGLTRKDKTSFAYYLIENFIKKLPADNSISEENIHLIADYADRYKGVSSYGHYLFDLARGRRGGMGAYLGFVARSTKSGPPGFLRSQLRFAVALPNSAYAAMHEYKRDIQKAGGIDIELHGIGLDGHLAFAEPPHYSKKDGTIQIVRLDPSTMDYNEPDYPGIRKKPYAISFGMGDILEAGKIFQLINGTKKAAITQKAWRGLITDVVPSALLRGHSNTVLILDTDAASAMAQIDPAQAEKLERFKAGVVSEVDSLYREDFKQDPEYVELLGSKASKSFYSIKNPANYVLRKQYRKFVQSILKKEGFDVTNLGFFSAKEFNLHNFRRLAALWAARDWKGLFHHLVGKILFQIQDVGIESFFSNREQWRTIYYSNISFAHWPVSVVCAALFSAETLILRQSLPTLGQMLMVMVIAPLAVNLVVSFTSEGDPNPRLFQLAIIEKARQEFFPDENPTDFFEHFNISDLDRALGEIKHDPPTREELKNSVEPIFNALGARLAEAGPDALLNAVRRLNENLSRAAENNHWKTVEMVVRHLPRHFESALRRTDDAKPFFVEIAASLYLANRLVWRQVQTGDYQAAEKNLTVVLLLLDRYGHHPAVAVQYAQVAETLMQWLSRCLYAEQNPQEAIRIWQKNQPLFLRFAKGNPIEIRETERLLKEATWIYQWAQRLSYVVEFRGWIADVRALRQYGIRHGISTRIIERSRWVLPHSHLFLNNRYSMSYLRVTELLGVIQRAVAAENELDPNAQEALVRLIEWEQAGKGVRGVEPFKIRHRFNRPVDIIVGHLDEPAMYPIYQDAISVFFTRLLEQPAKPNFHLITFLLHIYADNLKRGLVRVNGAAPHDLLLAAAAYSAKHSLGVLQLIKDKLLAESKLPVDSHPEQELRREVALSALRKILADEPDPKMRVDDPEAVRPVDDLQAVAVSAAPSTVFEDPDAAQRLRAALQEMGLPKGLYSDEVLLRILSALKLKSESKKPAALKSIDRRLPDLARKLADAVKTPTVLQSALAQIADSQGSSTNVPAKENEPIEISWEATEQMLDEDRDAQPMAENNGHYRTAFRILQARFLPDFMKIAIEANPTAPIVALLENEKDLSVLPAEFLAEDSLRPVRILRSRHYDYDPAVTARIAGILNEALSEGDAEKRLTNYFDSVAPTVLEKVIRFRQQEGMGADAGFVLAISPVSEALTHFQLVIERMIAQKFNRPRKEWPTTTSQLKLPKAQLRVRNNKNHTVDRGLPQARLLRSARSTAHNSYLESLMPIVDGAIRSHERWAHSFAKPGGVVVRTSFHQDNHSAQRLIHPWSYPASDYFDDELESLVALDGARVIRWPRQTNFDLEKVVQHIGAHIVGTIKEGLGARLSSSATVPQYRYWAVDKRNQVLSVPTDLKHDQRSDLLQVLSRTIGKSAFNLRPIGRLDYDVTGLMIFTDDPDALVLMLPQSHVEKHYVAWVNGRVDDKALKRLREGVDIPVDGHSYRTKPADAYLESGSRDIVHLKIREGKKHQVKLMLAAVGHPVIRLQRHAIGPVERSDLEWPRNGIIELKGGNLKPLLAAKEKAWNFLLDSADKDAHEFTRAVASLAAFEGEGATESAFKLFRTAYQNNMDSRAGLIEHLIDRLGHDMRQPIESLGDPIVALDEKLAVRAIALHLTHASGAVHSKMAAYARSLIQRRPSVVDAFQSWAAAWRGMTSGSAEFRAAHAVGEVLGLEAVSAAPKPEPVTVFHESQDPENALIPLARFIGAFAGTWVRRTFTKSSSGARLAEIPWHARAVAAKVDTTTVLHEMVEIRKHIPRINKGLPAVFQLSNAMMSDAMIGHYAQAIEHLNLILNEPMTADLLERLYWSLHEDLGRGGVVPSAGAPRDEVHRARIHRTMQDLFSDESARQIDSDPVAFAACFFTRLVNIQGFHDGSKRASALIMNYILLKAGFSPFILTHKNAKRFLKIISATLDDEETEISEKAFRAFLQTQVYPADQVPAGSSGKRAWHERVVQGHLNAADVQANMRLIRDMIPQINRELDLSPGWQRKVLDLSDQIIEQYGAAIEQLNDSLDEPMTADKFLNFFLNLHESLARDGAINRPGEMTDPTKDERKVRQLFEEMFSDKWTAKAKRDPAGAAAHVFATLVNIQSLSDGNKRTSSLIMNYVLLKLGYTPFILAPDNVIDYTRIVTTMNDETNISERAFAIFLRSQVHPAGARLAKRSPREANPDFLRWAEEIQQSNPRLKDWYQELNQKQYEKPLTSLQVTEYFSPDPALSRLFELLKDGDELRRLLETLTLLREAFPYDKYRPGEWKAPLEHSAPIAFPYKDDILLSPATDSFRRHLVGIRRPEGVRWFELKIPGREKFRLTVSQNGVVAGDYQKAYPNHSEDVASVLATVRAEGDFELYGIPRPFYSSGTPLYIHVLDYQDGKRILKFDTAVEKGRAVSKSQNLNYPYILRVYAERSGDPNLGTRDAQNALIQSIHETGILPAGLYDFQMSIARQIMGIAIRLLALGYQGQTSHGTEWHLENFKLLPNGKVQAVSDFDAFHKTPLPEDQWKEEVRELLWPLIWFNKFEFDETYEEALLTHQVEQAKRSQTAGARLAEHSPSKASSRLRVQNAKRELLAMKTRSWNTIYAVYSKAFDGIQFRDDEGSLYRLTLQTKRLKGEYYLSFSIDTEAWRVGSFGMTYRPSSDALEIETESSIISKRFEGRGIVKSLHRLLRRTIPARMKMRLIGDIGNISTLVQLNEWLPAEMRDRAKVEIDRFHREGEDDLKFWEEEPHHWKFLHENLINAYRAQPQLLESLTPKRLRQTKAGAIFSRFSPDMHLALRSLPDRSDNRIVLVAVKSGRPSGARLAAENDQPLERIMDFVAAHSNPTSAMDKAAHIYIDGELVDELTLWGLENKLWEYYFRTGQYDVDRLEEQDGNITIYLKTKDSFKTALGAGLSLRSSVSAAGQEPRFVAQEAAGNDKEGARMAVLGTTQTSTISGRLLDVQNDLIEKIQREKWRQPLRIADIGLGGQDIIFKNWAPTFFELGQALHKLIGNKFELIGIDVNSEVISQAALILSSSTEPVYKNLQVRKMNFTDLPKLGDFMAVRLMNVLMYSMPAQIRQAIHSLEPTILENGVLYLGTVSAEAMMDGFVVFRKKNGRLVPEELHFNMEKAKSAALEDLVKGTGIQIEELASQLRIYLDARFRTPVTFIQFLNAGLPYDVSEKDGYLVFKVNEDGQFKVGGSKAPQTTESSPGDSLSNAPPQIEWNENDSMLLRWIVNESNVRENFSTNDVYYKSRHLIPKRGSSIFPSASATLTRARKLGFIEPISGAGKASVRYRVTLLGMERFTAVEEPNKTLGARLAETPIATSKSTAQNEIHLPIWNRQSQRMTTLRYLRGDQLSESMRQTAIRSLQNWNHAQVRYDWMLTRVLSWLSYNSPELKEMRFALSADDHVQGYAQIVQRTSRPPYFLSDPVPPSEPSSVEVYLVETNPENRNEQGRYRGVGEELFIRALDEYPRESKQSVVAVTKIRSPRFANLFESALNWPSYETIRKEEVQLTRKDVTRLKNYQNRRIQQWRAESAAGARLADRSNVAIEISLQQIQELLAIKSKPARLTRISEILGARQGDLSRVILNALSPSEVSSGIPQERMMGKLTFDVTGLLTLHVENIIDSYMQRRFEDPQYAKDLRLEFSSFVKGQDIVLRLIANGMSLDRAWKIPDKKKHADIQLGGAGIGLNFSHQLAKILKLSVQPVGDRGQLVRDGEEGSVTDIYIPLVFVQSASGIRGARLAEDQRLESILKKSVSIWQPGDILFILDHPQITIKPDAKFNSVPYSKNGLKRRFVLIKGNDKWTVTLSNIGLSNSSVEIIKRISAENPPFHQKLLRTNRLLVPAIEEMIAQRLRVSSAQSATRHSDVGGQAKIGRPSLKSNGARLAETVIPAPAEGRVRRFGGGEAGIQKHLTGSPIKTFGDDTYLAIARALRPKESVQIPITAVAGHPMPIMMIGLTPVSGGAVLMTATYLNAPSIFAYPNVSDRPVVYSETFTRGELMGRAQRTQSRGEGLGFRTASGQVFPGQWFTGLANVQASDTAALYVDMKEILKSNGRLKSAKELQEILQILNLSLVYRGRTSDNLKLVLYGNAALETEAIIQKTLASVSSKIQLTFVNTTDLSLGDSGLPEALKMRLVSQGIPITKTLGVVYSSEWQSRLGDAQEMAYVQTQPTEETSAYSILVALALGKEGKVDSLPSDLREKIASIATIAGRIVVSLIPAPISDFGLFLAELSRRTVQTSA